MRTITPKPFNVYQLNELSEEAKKKAIKEVQSLANEEPNFDLNDIIDSMKAIADVFDIKFNFHSHYNHHIFFRWETDDVQFDENAENMTGTRALKWINKRHEPRRLDYDYSNGSKAKAKKWALAKSRYIDNDFIGMWSDGGYNMAYTTFKKDLINGQNLCLKTFFSYLCSFYAEEYNQALDYFGSEEWAEARIKDVGYEFLQDGSLF